MKMFLGGVVLFLPLLTFAQGGYEIENFDVRVEVTEEGIVEVEEVIVVNFLEERHGIYRTLPYRYRGNDGTVYTKISDIEVWRNGLREQSDVSKNSANLSIRIGDPDVTISGNQTYRLNYAVEGVLRNVGSEDELYWNVTGNEWDTTIARATALFVLPEGVNTMNAACYEGTFGSTETCQVRAEESGAVVAVENLQPGEGLTGAVSWRAGMIPIATPQDPREIWKVLLVVLPLLTLGGSSWYFYRKWERYGMDPEIPETTVTQFNAPQNISPLHAGIILDNRADTIDVTSTLIELARQGYLMIEEVPGKLFGIGRDYILKRIEKDDENLPVSEQLLLGGIFEDGREVKLGDLKDTFYTTLNSVKRQAKIEVHKQGYYTRSLGNQVGLFHAVPLFVVTSIFLGAVAATLTQESLFVPMVVFSMLAFTIPAGVWAHYAPQLTEKGAETKYHLRGYKQFIETAEKHRAKFYEDNNLVFEVMPYAIMFGLAEKFAKKIEEMDIQVSTPSWYAAAHPLSLGDFGSDMSSFSSTLSSTMSSAPSSSGSGGGGSSGGGFGGGGGGSW